MLGVVYTIYTKSSNRYLVGFTNNFNRRKAQHVSDLKYNRHPNGYLQNAYNKNDSIEIEILEYYPVDILPAMEHFWCNTLRSNEREFGYNILPTNPYGFNLKISEETKKKISAKNSGRKRPDMVERMKTWRLSPESIEKMRKTKTGKKVKPWNPERRAKFMNSIKNRKNGVMDR